MSISQKKSAPETNRGADDSSIRGRRISSVFPEDITFRTEAQSQLEIARQLSLAVDAQWDGIHYFEDQIAQCRRRGESTLLCDLLADRYRRRLRVLERWIPVGEVRP